MCYACNKPTCIGDQYIKLAKLVFWSVSQTLSTKQVRVLNIALKLLSGVSSDYKKLQKVCKFNVVNLLNSWHENICLVKSDLKLLIPFHIPIYLLFTNIEIITLPIWVLNRNYIQQNGKEIHNFIFHLLCRRKYVYELCLYFIPFGLPILLIRWSFYSPKNCA